MSATARGDSQASGLHVSEPAPGGWGLWVGVLAGQGSRAERSPGQYAGAQAADHRDKLPLDLALDEGVLDLQACEGGPAAVRGQGLYLGHHPGGGVRDPR
jgi:hypothetical protein